MQDKWQRLQNTTFGGGGGVALNKKYFSHDRLSFLVLKRPMVGMAIGTGQDGNSCREQPPSNGTGEHGKTPVGYKHRVT